MSKKSCLTFKLYLLHINGQDFLGIQYIASEFKAYITFCFQLIISIEVKLSGEHIWYYIRKQNQAFTYNTHYTAFIKAFFLWNKTAIKDLSLRDADAYIHLFFGSAFFVSSSGNLLMEWFFSMDIFLNCFWYFIRPKIWRIFKKLT